MRRRSDIQWLSLQCSTFIGWGALYSTRRCCRHNRFVTKNLTSSLLCRVPSGADYKRVGTVQPVKCCADTIILVGICGLATKGANPLSLAISVREVVERSPVTSCWLCDAGNAVREKGLEGNHRTWASRICQYQLYATFLHKRLRVWASDRSMQLSMLTCEIIDTNLVSLKRTVLFPKALDGINMNTEHHSCSIPCTGKSMHGVFRYNTVHGI